MGSGELVRAKWTLGIAAACMAALGFFSCAGGEVTGLSILSAAYNVIYEFDARFASDGIDNDGVNGTDDPGEACLDTCQDTDGNGVCDGVGVATSCPPAGSDEIRLELEHFDGAVARFVLRAYNFNTIDDAWRIRFGLTFNDNLLRYTYSSPGVGSHSPEYPGAVPWRKIPPTEGSSMELWPVAGDGLADGKCNRCCIEWTDYSCKGPGKKGETCLQDINPSDVSLCIKRSCTPSAVPGAGSSCTAASAIPAGPGVIPAVDCCDCTDTAAQSRHCRRTDPVDACEAPNRCHNTCDRPLFTELVGNPDADKQTSICCTEKALLQVEDWECTNPGEGCTEGTGCETATMGGFPHGTTPVGVVATIPLQVKAAREFDDFRFLFPAGGSSIHPYNSDAKTPISGTAFVAGKGTVIATE
jgi:hypothetical protein